MTTQKSLECVELTLGLFDGGRVAVKCWGDEKAPIKVLALHGWLDNASTWDPLIPFLLNSGLPIRFVAMDFLGHGNSSHAPPSGSYLPAERVIEVTAVADALNWNSFVLMGHSMGAAVATLVAGTIPNRIEKLILVEGIGPFKFHTFSEPELLEFAIKERPQLLRRQRKIYPNLDAALDRYVKNSGNRIFRSSARLLVMRGTEEVQVQTSPNGVDQQQESDVTPTEKGVCFKHDHKLVGKPVMTYSEKTIQMFLDRINMPSLLVLGTNDKRVEVIGEERAKKWGEAIKGRASRVKDLKTVIVKGEHHVHMDNPELVSPHILELLRRPTPNNKSKL